MISGDNNERACRIKSKNYSYLTDENKKSQRHRKMSHRKENLNLKIINIV